LIAQTHVKSIGLAPEEYEQAATKLKAAKKALAARGARLIFPARIL
jgi:hypothetical protein